MSARAKASGSTAWPRLPCGPPSATCARLSRGGAGARMTSTASSPTPRRRGGSSRGALSWDSRKACRARLLRCALEAAREPFVKSAHTLLHPTRTSESGWQTLAGPRFLGLALRRSDKPLTALSVQSVNDPGPAVWLQALIGASRGQVGGGSRSARSFITPSSRCFRSIAAGVAHRQGSPERRIAYTRSHIFRRATACARAFDFVLRSRLLNASLV